MPDAPNIIYLHSHDTGRLIQPYGYSVRTPNLQRLAEDGVLFRNAHAAAPTCSPSRAALLTGQSPHECGMLGLAHRGFSLTDPTHHLAHTLGSAGYRCVLAGLQHVAHGDEVQGLGYHEIVGTAATAEQDAAAFLATATESEPFFLDVGFAETHRRAVAGGHFTGDQLLGDPRYVLPPAPLPDTPEVRADVADFGASAARLDAKIGVVLEALRDSGAAERTVVIFTTDHGPAFPGMKCQVTTSGTGVALVVRAPAQLPAGTVVDGLVSHLDLYPTLCELARIEAPDWLEGRSLLPLAHGQVEQVNDEVFSEVSFHAAYEPKRAVRTRRYVYVRNMGDYRRPVLPNCDDGLSKSQWVDSGWLKKEIPAEELYDTVFDPIEMVNLADDPAAAQLLSDMRARLDGWMLRTHDPLLAGPVPAPAGARVNDSGGASPTDPPR